MKQHRIKTKKIYISVLINSAHYYLENVLIQCENKQYRLLVINNNSKYLEKTFNTLKGAKISFSKSFSKRRLKSTKASWSDLYPPEPGWLEKMLKMPLRIQE
jgi:hypothetical protein